MNAEYKVNFNVDHINCDNFKEKYTYMFNRNIEESRLRMFMKFSSFGRISFDDDDKNHKHPIITEQEKFNRLKTNCLIYDLLPNDYNPGLFDKLFIYQTLTKKAGWFGYVLYNTETGNTLHKYYVELTDCGLMTTLHKTFRYLLERQTKEWMS